MKAYCMIQEEEKKTGLVVYFTNLLNSIMFYTNTLIFEFDLFA